MDTTKVGPGEMIAGISGLALFIFMFLPWYGVKASASFGGSDFSVNGGNVSAWQAFSFIDVLLFLAAVVVVGLVIVEVAESNLELPQPSASIIAGVGAFAVLLILFRLLVTPGGDTDGLGGVDVDVTRKIGALLGLIAAGGITYGGWRAMNAPAAAPVGGGRPVPPAAEAPPTPAPQASPTPQDEPPAGGQSQQQ